MNVYEIVTDRIIKSLEQGIIPWQRPWFSTTERAMNYISKKPYSLLNQMLLGGPGYYMSFKQVQEKGGNVKKGAKSRIVVFWKQLQVDDEDADGNKIKKTIPMLRYYNVFSQTDIEGIEFPETQTNENAHPEETAEQIIKEYLDREPELKFQNDAISNQAYYSPSEDKVVVPMMSQYERISEYYSTAFHELTHSTLKETRCNRKTENKKAAFVSTECSKEELVAEIGAAALTNRSGLETDHSFQNSEAYIQNWLKKLQNDPKFIVSASGKAEKAVNYILGETVTEE